MNSSRSALRGIVSSFNQQLRNIRYRLQQAQRPNPVRSNPKLHPADDFTLEENRVGNEAEHDGKQNNAPKDEDQGIAPSQRFIKP